MQFDPRQSLAPASRPRVTDMGERAMRLAAVAEPAYEVASYARMP